MIHQTNCTCNFIYNQMDRQQDEEYLGRRAIPGLTPEAVAAELAENPIVFKYWKKNPEDIQKRLIDTFMRMPSDSDCPGFIYGFRNMQQYDWRAKSYSIKMGRTSRLVPQKRIFEWQRDDCHKYVEIFTIRSEYNMKLECLVHLVFDYARETKVINGKKRIEWFTFDQKVPTAAVTNLLNTIMENLHQKQYSDNAKLEQIEKQQNLFNEIITKQNQYFRKVLQNLKRAIHLYLKKGTEKTIAIFKQIIEQDSLEKAKSYIQQIIQQNLAKQITEKVSIDVDSGTETKQTSITTQVKVLKEFLLKLRGTIQTMQNYQSKYPIKFNSILGRVKQAVYFGLKGESIQKGEVQNESQDQVFELIKVQKSLQQITISISNKVSKKQGSPSSKQSPESKNQKLQLVSDEQSTATEAKPKKDKKHKNGKKQQQFRQIDNSQPHLSKTKLSELFQYAENVQIGKTIINIVDGDFTIDDKTKIVSHNLIILAKRIIVTKQSWSIRFNSEAAKNSRKLNLVLMGQAMVNITRVKPPKNTPNGFASILVLNEDDSLLGLDDNLKNNPERLDQDFYQGIKTIFKQKIK